ncbi:unnamed protein product, partial [marine sediment metagenome]
MQKKIGRNEYILGKFLSKPIFVSAPSMEEWTDLQLKKFQKNELSSKMLESISKSYSFWGEEPYLATMFFPTLTITQETEFSDRIKGMGHWLQIITLGMKDAAKRAEFDTYKRIADNVIEERRIMEEKLHRLGDVVGRETSAYQELELSFKESKIPFKLSNTIESLPSYRPPQKSTSTVFSVAAKVKEKARLNPIEVLAWIMIVLGVPLSVIGMVGVAFYTAPFGLALIGSMILLVGVLLMWWLHKNDPKSKLPKKE